MSLSLPRAADTDTDIYNSRLGTWSCSWTTRGTEGACSLPHGPDDSESRSQAVQVGTTTDQKSDLMRGVVSRTRDFGYGLFLSA